MHDRTVRVDRPLDNLIVVLQVDDYDLGFVVLFGLLSDANEMIGFQSLRRMSALFTRTE